MDKQKSRDQMQERSELKQQLQITETKEKAKPKV